MKHIIIAVLLFVVSLGALAQGNYVNVPDVPNRHPTNIRPYPIYIDARVLAANVNESWTPPAGARFVVFSKDCAVFYVKNGGTAAVPAADVTDGTASEMNPTAYYFNAVPTAIGMISPATCIVTMAVYLGPVR